MNVVPSALLSVSLNARGHLVCAVLPSGDRRTRPSGGETWIWEAPSALTDRSRPYGGCCVFAQRRAWAVHLGPAGSPRGLSKPCV